MKIKEKSTQMTFYLKINLKDFQLKSGIIDLKKFLDSNNSIACSIECICSFSHYVNFAETIINSFKSMGVLILFLTMNILFNP